MRNFFIVLTIIFFTLQSHQGLADDYLAAGVRVNAVGESATKAREQAVQQGQKQAFLTIVKRIAPSASLEALAEFIPELAPEQEAETISRMVSAMEVRNESVTNTSYSALLDIRFQPEYVRAFLQENNIAFQEHRGTSMLVLPVVFTAGETPSVSTTTPWASAWKSAANQAQSARIKLLLPHANDPAISSINPVQLLSESYTFTQDSNLRAISKRYGVSHIIFAAMRQVEGQNQAIEIALRVFGDSNPLDFSEHLQANAEEDEQALLVRTAYMLRSRIEGNRAFLDTNLSQTDNVEVTIPLKGLESWLNTKRRLEELSFIRSLKLEQLSSSSALVRLAFSAKPAALGESFANASFYLEEYEGKLVLNSAQPSAQPSFFNLNPQQ